MATYQTYSILGGLQKWQGEADDSAKAFHQARGRVVIAAGETVTVTSWNGRGYDTETVTMEVSGKIRTLGSKRVYSDSI